MGTIGQIFRAVAEALMFWKQKDAQKNTQPVIDAKLAQNQISAQDASEKAVAAGNLEKMRKDMAE